MEHCVAGKEKYLASGSGLFGRAKRKNPFDSKTVRRYFIFFAQQLNHKPQRLNPFKRVSAVDDVDKLADGDDRNAAEFFEVKEMTVSTDDSICFAFNGAFQDAVVGRVGMDHVQSMSWRDGFSTFCQHVQERHGFFRVDVQFFQKHALQFYKNGVAHKKTRAVVSGQGECERGEAIRFDDGRNENVRVKDDSHLMFVSLFSAKLLDQTVNVFLRLYAQFFGLRGSVPLNGLQFLIQNEAFANRLPQILRTGAVFALGMPIDQLHQLGRHGQIECDGHGGFPPCFKYIQTLYVRQYRVAYA